MSIEEELYLIEGILKNTEDRKERKFKQEKSDFLDLIKVQKKFTSRDESILQQIEKKLGSVQTCSNEIKKMDEVKKIIKSITLNQIMLKSVSNDTDESELATKKVQRIKQKINSEMIYLKENQVFQKIIVDELKSQMETLEKIIGMSFDLNEMASWKNYLNSLQQGSTTNHKWSIIAYCTVCLSDCSFNNNSEVKLTQKEKVKRATKK